MLESHKLPNKLRRGLEKELEPDESLQWVEQPIPRFFNRTSIGICLGLLLTLTSFSFISLHLFQQARDLELTLFEMIGHIGVAVILMGTVIPLMLLIFVPISIWLEARQTVYAITNQRALILTVGRATTVLSFMPAELRAVSRRENKDGSGDVIVYTYRSQDYDGDVQTQEIGFKQVRQPKAFEQRLRQIA
jgi:hypothetical protein